MALNHGVHQLCYVMLAKNLVKSSLDVSTFNSIFRSTYSLQYVNDILIIM